MTGVHIAIGVGMVAVNVLAALVGAYQWWRAPHARLFWPLLRAGQALTVLAAADGLILVIGGHELPEREKFAGIPHSVHDGIPVIEGVLAWVGCRLERLIPGGDHTIGIGSVEAAEAGEGEPLLWFRGGYRG